MNTTQTFSDANGMRIQPGVTVSWKNAIRHTEHTGKVRLVTQTTSGPIVWIDGVLVGKPLREVRWVAND